MKALCTCGKESPKLCSFKCSCSPGAHLTAPITCGLGAKILQWTNLDRTRHLSVSPAHLQPLQHSMEVAGTAQGPRQEPECSMGPGQMLHFDRPGFPPLMACPPLSFDAGSPQLHFIFPSFSASQCLPVSRRGQFPGAMESSAFR